MTEKWIVTGMRMAGVPDHCRNEKASDKDTVRHCTVVDSEEEAFTESKAQLRTGADFVYIARAVAIAEVPVKVTSLMMQPEVDIEDALAEEDGDPVPADSDYEPPEEEDGVPSHEPA